MEISSTSFWVFGMTQPGIETRIIEEFSNHFTNGQFQVDFINDFMTVPM